MIVIGETRTGCEVWGHRPNQRIEKIHRVKSLYKRIARLVAALFLRMESFFVWPQKPLFGGIKVRWTACRPIVSEPGWVSARSALTNHQNSLIQKIQNIPIGGIFTSAYQYLRSI